MPWRWSVHSPRAQWQQSTLVLGKPLHARNTNSEFICEQLFIIVVVHACIDLVSCHIHALAIVVHVSRSYSYSCFSQCSISSHIHALAMNKINSIYLHTFRAHCMHIIPLHRQTLVGMYLSTCPHHLAPSLFKPTDWLQTFCTTWKPKKTTSVCYSMAARLHTRPLYSRVWSLLSSPKPAPHTQSH